MQPQLGTHAGMMPNGAIQPLQNGAGQGFGLMYTQPPPVAPQPSTQGVHSMPKLDGPSFF